MYECVTGFTDMNCTTKIDDCNLNPCENNETYSDLVDDFVCEYTAGLIYR